MSLKGAPIKLPLTVVLMLFPAIYTKNPHLKTNRGCDTDGQIVVGRYSMLHPQQQKPKAPLVLPTGLLVLTKYDYG
jgi:hypothetical protein